MILTTTNKSATYPHTDNKSAKKPTSDILIVINPLCSSLNKNAARALQSSVYHMYISIVRVEGSEAKGDDTPCPHPSNPKTRTTPRVDWVLAGPHGRSARRRLLLSKTLPSTPNPALTLDQSKEQENNAHEPTYPSPPSTNFDTGIPVAFATTLEISFDVTLS